MVKREELIERISESDVQVLDINDIVFDITKSELIEILTFKREIY